MNILWSCCTAEVGGLLSIKFKERLQAMISLQGSARNLLREMEHLQSYRNDKENEVRLEERKNYQMKRTKVVEGWLKSVDELGDKVAGFERYLDEPRDVSGGEASGSGDGANPYHTAGDHRSGDSSCLCNMLRRCGGRLGVLVKLSGEVADLIGDVRDLRKEGEEIKKLVMEVDGTTSETCHIEMVGEEAKQALDDIHRYLAASTNGIIGIYGMGGVGKSSLLKQIKHEYTHARKQEFPRVIWAEVTRQVDMDELLKNPDKKDVVDLERLRNIIGKDLPKSSSGWSPESLKEALSCSRFLLLLENVWEKLDLDVIGIPAPDAYNKCKIVFTTRSDAVRKEMNATGVKLSRLAEEEAYELFRRHLNNDALLASCEDYAQDIVRECHGLPLALIVMARVMRSKNFTQDWVDTIEALQDPRTMFDDGVLGEDAVLKILRYSYCHLKDEWRPCLVYCSLFDDGTMATEREELVDYWIGEGFFDGVRGDVTEIKAARKKGRDVINHLVSACLLERSSGDEDKVKMHGLIHDMAIRVAPGELLVYPDCMTKGEQKGENWEQATRISLAGARVSKLPTKNCPNLVTLLLKNCEGLTEIPEKFFDEMSALRVLDLSNTQIEQLPRGIGSAKQLRHLNLSRTRIRFLPVEVRELSELIQLNLSYTRGLEEIPYEAISAHDQLRTLNLLESKYQRWVSNAAETERGVSLIDLEGLPNLEELSLNINDYVGFEDLLDSEIIATRTVRLYLEGFQGIKAEPRFEVLEELRELYIANILDLKKLVFKRRWLLNLETLWLSSLSVANIITISEEDGKARAVNLCRLRRVEISRCNNLEDLSWVRHLRSLRSLSVNRCRNLKVVIASDGGRGADKVRFSSLKWITLAGLPELERVCECRMEISSVPSITVDDCPNLTGEFVYYDKDGKQIKIAYQDCQNQVLTSD